MWLILPFLVACNNEIQPAGYSWFQSFFVTHGLGYHVVLIRPMAGFEPGTFKRPLLNHCKITVWIDRFCFLTLKFLLLLVWREKDLELKILCTKLCPMQIFWSGRISDLADWTPSKTRKLQKIKSKAVNVFRYIFLKIYWNCSEICWSNHNWWFLSC